MAAGVDGGTTADFRPWCEAVDAGEPVGGDETLGSVDLTLEALGLGLRTRAGVDLDAVRERFGIDVRTPNEALTSDLQRQGLLEPDTGSLLVPTLEGLALADSLAASYEIPPA